MALMLFASPLPTIRAVVARRDVGDTSGLPYVAFGTQVRPWALGAGSGRGG